MTNNSNDAIWLYGSHSRGNDDAASDIDVLFVTDVETNDIPWEQIPRFSKRPDISRYTWAEVEQMAEYGSLFLKHLSLEAQPIYEAKGARGRLRNLLGSLCEYQLALRDLKGFIAVHDDIAESLNDGMASLIYETAILATIFRHACILGCDLAGSPCFSRVKPVQDVVAMWGLPETWAEEFPRLYSYRLYTDGREDDVVGVDVDYIWEWHKRAGALLTEIQRRIDG